MRTLSLSLAMALSRRAAARAVCSLVLAAGLLASLVLPAAAHPHVWVKVRLNLVVENGAVTGVHHIWVMDEAWLQSQLDDLDADKDGRLTQEEMKPLVVESRSTLEMFKSFTWLRVGGKRLRPMPPADLAIDYFGDRLGLTFVTPLPQPIPLAGADLLLEVYDDTYFSGFTLAAPDAVAFLGIPPTGCRIDAQAPASPQHVSAYRATARAMGPDFAAKDKPPHGIAIRCTAVDRMGAADAVGLVRTSNPR